MSFYIDWETKKNTGEELKYMDDFLMVTPESVEVFHWGTNSEIAKAVEIINSVRIEEYVSLIDKLSFDEDVVGNQVPQFSDFNDGAYRIPELLEFEPSGLSFEKLGYQLVKSPTEGAGIKYGENHSKLANMMELVEITNRPSNVVSTALGRYLVSFLPEEKKEVLKRLLLRQYLVQKMISGAAEEVFSYRDAVSKLSKATAIRRRNNVRKVLEFILCGTEDEIRLDRIDWQVEE